MPFSSDFIFAKGTTQSEWDFLAIPGNVPTTTPTWGYTTKFQGIDPSLQDRRRVARLVLRRPRRRRPRRGGGAQSRAGHQWLFRFCRRARNGSVRHRRSGHIHLRPWRLRPDGRRSGRVDPESSSCRRHRGVERLLGRHGVVDPQARCVWLRARRHWRGGGDPSAASASPAFAPLASTVGSSARADCCSRRQDRSRSSTRRSPA